MEIWAIIEVEGSSSQTLVGAEDGGSLTIASSGSIAFTTSETSNFFAFIKASLLRKKVSLYLKYIDLLIGLSQLFNHFLDSQTLLSY